MGKLGSFFYPDLTLNEAIELVRKIGEVGGAVSPTGLAKLVSIDPRGAGLHSRIEDLKTYGFIEANGQLTLSSSAQELLDGNMQRAWEAFWNIPLYAEMDRRLQGKEPTDKVVLNHILYNITKADTNDIARRASRLKNNYMEAQPYRSGGKKPDRITVEGSDMQSSSRPGMNRPEFSPNQFVDSNLTLMERGSKLFLIFDRNLSQLALAQAFLATMKEKLVEEGKAKPEKRSISAKNVEVIEEITH